MVSLSCQHGNKPTMSLLSVFMLLMTTASVIAVVELEADQEGKPIWMQGEYRDRNDVPVPENYDARRKHRDVSDQEETNFSAESKKSQAVVSKDKKGFIRSRFMMPFGVELPLQYSGQLFHFGGKKGKKNRVPQRGLKRSRIQKKLNIAGKIDGYYIPLNIDAHRSRSHVPSTWGMLWQNNNPRPESPIDSPGELRSTLRGGLKLKEEDIDDGLMFRGLGGQEVRAQNEALIEGKFDEKMANEEEERGTEGRM